MAAFPKKLFCIITMVIGTVVFASATSAITNLLTNYDQENAVLNKNLETAQSHLLLPSSDLAAKVLPYCCFVGAAQSQNIDDSETVHGTADDATHKLDDDRCPDDEKKGLVMFATSLDALMISCEKNSPNFMLIFKLKLKCV